MFFEKDNPSEKISFLMKEFINWLNSDDVSQLHPVLIAGLSHYEFVRIHPFVDGNGRTARALATLILYLREFDIKRFFALDDYYDGDRSAYYNALKSVHPKTLDLTSWLDYFTDGVRISISRVRGEILRLSSAKLKRGAKGQIALTNRQIKIIEYIQKTGRITAGDTAKMFNITRQAALKELSKLVEKEIIELKGKGRGAHYILT